MGLGVFLVGSLIAREMKRHPQGTWPASVVVRLALQGNTAVRRIARQHLLNHPELHADAIRELGKALQNGETGLSFTGCHPISGAVSVGPLEIPVSLCLQASGAVTLVDRQAKSRARDVLAALLAVAADNLKPMLTQLLEQ